MKKIMLVVMFLLVSACDWNKKDPIDIQTVVSTPIVCVNEPSIDTFTIRNFKFKDIIGVDGIIHIGLDANEYQNLALNHTNMKKNMKQKNTVILYYRSCLNKN